MCARAGRAAWECIRISLNSPEFPGIPRNSPLRKIASTGVAQRRWCNARGGRQLRVQAVAAVSTEMGNADASYTRPSTRLVFFFDVVVVADVIAVVEKVAVVIDCAVSAEVLPPDVAIVTALNVAVFSAVRFFDVTASPT